MECDSLMSIVVDKPSRRVSSFGLSEADERSLKVFLRFVGNTDAARWEWSIPETCDLLITGVGEPPPVAHENPRKPVLVMIVDNQSAVSSDSTAVLRRPLQIDDFSDLLQVVESTPRRRGPRVAESTPVVSKIAPLVSPPARALEAVPQFLRKAPPEAVQQVLPEAPAETVLLALAQAPPKTAPQVLAEVPPETAPQVLAEDPPETVPQALAEDPPETVPQALVEDPPETVPQALSEDPPETVPQALPEDPPETVPQVLPQAAPRPMLEAVPRPAPRSRVAPVPRSLEPAERSGRYRLVRWPKAEFLRGRARATRLLSFLASGHLSVQQLSALSGADRSSCVALLDALDAAGYLETQASPSEAASPRRPALVAVAAPPADSPVPAPPAGSPAAVAEAAEPSAVLAAPENGIFGRLRRRLGLG
jgi:hypothetical protein